MSILKTRVKQIKQASQSPTVGKWIKVAIILDVLTILSVAVLIYKVL